MFFSDQLRRVRGSRTQTEMANLLGVKQQHYARYETGVTTPGIDVLYKFCKILGVSADVLLGLDSTRTGDIAIGNNNFNSGRIGADCSNCPVLKAAAKKLNN